MRYFIRRVGPAHALGLGCVIGVVLAMLPALAAILLALLVRSSATRLLDALGPLGSALAPQLDLSWNAIGLSIFLLLVFSGLFYAVGAWLVAVGYNLVARITGGLAVDLDPAASLGAVQTLGPSPMVPLAPVKDPTMPLPRGFPLPPPAAGSTPAGPLAQPAPGLSQPSAVPPAVGASRLPPLPASPSTPHAWLVSSAESSLRWELRNQVTSIGSGPANDIVLASDGAVAAKHAEIRAESSGYVLYDLGSAGGTLVNDRPVQGRNLLKDGFRIKVGKTELQYRLLP